MDGCDPGRPGRGDRGGFGGKNHTEEAAAEKYMAQSRAVGSAAAIPRVYPTITAHAPLVTAQDNLVFEPTPRMT